jgi:DNA-binding NtrC family response regulator
MPLPKVLTFSRDRADGDEFTKIVGAESYEIHWTDNGPETIIRALSGGLDIVVIFLRRKGHRELEYIPCLNSIDQHLPIIVISDHDSLKLQREIRKHRVFYYLPQPVDAEEIRAVMRDAAATAAKRHH